jgi:hypothetical protein
MFVKGRTKRNIVGEVLAVEMRSNATGTCARVCHTYIMRGPRCSCMYVCMYNYNVCMYECRCSCLQFLNAAPAACFFGACASVCVGAMLLVNLLVLRLNSLSSIAQAVPPPIRQRIFGEKNCVKFSRL